MHGNLLGSRLRVKYRVIASSPLLGLESTLIKKERLVWEREGVKKGSWGLGRSVVRVVMLLGRKGVLACQ